MADDKQNLTSIDVDFKPNTHLLDTAKRLRLLADAIEKGEVYGVAAAFVGPGAVVTCLSVSRERFELAGAVAHLAHRIHNNIDSN